MMQIKTETVVGLIIFIFIILGIAFSIGEFINNIFMSSSICFLLGIITLIAWTAVQYGKSKR